MKNTDSEALEQQRLFEEARIKYEKDPFVAPEGPSVASIQKMEKTELSETLLCILKEEATRIKNIPHDIEESIWEQIADKFKEKIVTQ